MTYHRFTSDSGDPYGSFETFQMDSGDCIDAGRWQFSAAVPATDRITYSPGWYWQPCFPGCLPDGDPMGPFETEELAIADANGAG